MNKAPTYEEIKPLIQLIREGKLFDVQDWIAKGKPINPPEPESKGRRHKGPLECAIDTGFYSMVEILAGAGANFYEPGPRNWTRFIAVEAAAVAKRMDLVELLVESGADVRQASMLSIYETWDPALMRYFIDYGADPGQDNALAMALCWRIRTVLGIFKRYKDQYPLLQGQLNTALRYHVKQGHKKWTSLTLWAGGDPYEIGPDEVEGEVDPECDVSAFQLALWLEHDWFFDFKQVKLLPEHEGAKGIFEEACASKCGPLFDSFIDAGFADVCALKDQTELITRVISSMTHVPLELLFSTDMRSAKLLDTERCRDGIRKIKLLLRHGWKWEPSIEAVRSIRRDLLKIDGKYFVQLLELLGQYQAAPSVILHEVIRTPTAQARLRANHFNPDQYLKTLTG